MTFESFALPPIPIEALSVLVSLFAAATLAALLHRLNLSFGPSSSRTLAAYLAAAQESGAARPLAISRDAVILLSLGLPPNPRLLLWLKLLAGGVPGLILLLAGFPLIPSLGAGALTAILANSFLQSRWRAFRMQMEQELPTFVSRLAGTLLVTASPQKAIQEVTDTLVDGSPLHSWLAQLLVGLRVEGVHALSSAQTDAAAVSPSLALVLFQIRRFFETGGSGFTRAFATTASELSAILEARAVAGAKAEAARGAVLTMLAIIAGILLLMLSTENIRQGFAEPAVQLIAAICLSAMGFGYLFLNGMIDEAME